MTKDIKIQTKHLVIILLAPLVLIFILLFTTAGSDINNKMEDMVDSHPLIQLWDYLDEVSNRE